MAPLAWDPGLLAPLGLGACLFAFAGHASDTYAFPGLDSGRSQAPLMLPSAVLATPAVDAGFMSRPGLDDDLLALAGFSQYADLGISNLFLKTFAKPCQAR